MSGSVRFGGGGAAVNLAVTSYASALLIPASGRVQLVDIAIISAIAAPRVETGGIMVYPANVSPTTRLDGTALQNGDVILDTASIGTVTPNISNVFKLPLIGARQRQAGAWVNVEAHISNRGAAYERLMFAAYYLGNEFASITGGWSLINSTYATKNADNILLSAPSTISAAIHTANSFDVTEFSTMHILSKFDSARTSPCIAGITASMATASNGYNERLASVVLTTNTTQTESVVDVAAITGMVKAAAWAVSGTARGSNIYKVWFT